MATKMCQQVAKRGVTTERFDALEIVDFEIFKGRFLQQLFPDSKGERRRKCDDVDKLLLKIYAFSKVFCIKWNSCLRFVDASEAENAMTQIFL